MILVSSSLTSHREWHKKRIAEMSQGLPPTTALNSAFMKFLFHSLEHCANIFLHGLSSILANGDESLYVSFKGEGCQTAWFAEYLIGGMSCRRF